MTCATITPDDPFFPNEFSPKDVLFGKTCLDFPPLHTRSVLIQEARLDPSDPEAPLRAAWVFGALLARAAKTGIIPASDARSRFAIFQNQLDCASGARLIHCFPACMAQAGCFDPFDVPAQAQTSAALCFQFIALFERSEPRSGFIGLDISPKPSPASAIQS